MAKKKCDICGVEVGRLSQCALKDGMVCFDCRGKLGKKFEVPWTDSFSVEQISKAIAGEIELIPPQVFQCTNGVLIIDSSNRVMYMSMLLGIRTDEISMDSIVGYTYVEDDKKYGVGHIVGTAAVGGILFGGVGAVIGSVIGSNPKRKITHIEVEITYETGGICELFHAKIYKGKPIKAGGFDYNSYLDIAKSLMGQLDLLIKKTSTATDGQERMSVQMVSNADEIKKYKELFDEGIITQEEFMIRKKELLGISEPIIHEKKSENKEVAVDVEKNCSIILKRTENKVMAIKAYRELAEQKEGIRKAKSLIDQVPVIIFEGLSKEQADYYIQTFLKTDSTATLECIQNEKIE